MYNYIYNLKLYYTHKYVGCKSIALNYKIVLRLDVVSFVAGNNVIV